MLEKFEARLEWCKALYIARIQKYSIFSAELLKICVAAGGDGVGRKQS